jgi:hypothetical protein
MPDLAAGVGITLAKETATNLLRIGTSVVSGRLAFATYADLAAVTDQAKGTPAEVPIDDAGTHTDPVVGGTVDNSGIYSWSASPAGWRRIADVDALSAEGAAARAAISETNAAASLATLLSAPVGAALPPTKTLTINGQQPALVLDGYDASGLSQSFMAFMQDGSLVSASIAAFITNMLGGAKMSLAEVPGWLFVVDAIGTDGLSYVLAGVKTDGTIYPSGQANYDYAPGDFLPTGDRPVLLTGGWNGMQAHGQSLGGGEGPQAKPSVSTTPSTYDKTFIGGQRTGKVGNTCSAVVIGSGTSDIKALVEQDDAIAGDGTANGGETINSGAAAAFNRFAAKYLNLGASQLVKFRSDPAHGSYTVQDLSKTGSAGAWYNNWKDHTTEAVRLAGVAGKSYALHVVDYLQGEGDAGGGTAQATYTTKLRQLRSDMSADAMAATGQTVPLHMLVYQTASTVTGTLAQLAAIQRAQFDAITQDPYIHLATPIYHLPHGADGVHMPAVGYRWIGEYFGRAEAQLIVLGRVPDKIWPVSAIVGLNSAGVPQLEVLFNVPQRPLQFDTTLLNLTQDYGFQAIDDTGVLTLSNFKIVNGNKLVVTLNRLPTVSDPVNAPATISYAQAYLAPGVILNLGATGNLRDSTTDSFTFAGVTRSLAHWCPHFRLPIRTQEL